MFACAPVANPEKVPACRLASMAHIWFLSGCFVVLGLVAMVLFMGRADAIGRRPEAKS
jgi:hypothetical protein